MKTFLVLASICTSVSAFGVLSPHTTTSSATALSALLPKEDMSPDQLKMEEMRQNWNKIRLMDYDDIPEELGDEYKEAHKRYFEKYEKDMEHFQEIANKLEKILDPPKVQKKTKGQRKRDKWAKIQAREAFRAAQK